MTISPIRPDMPAQADAPPRPKIRPADALIQAAFVVAVAGALGWMAHNAATAIRLQGMSSGFGFLEQARAWSLSEVFFASPPTDTYLRTFLVGAANTLIVGILAIILSTLLGVLVGVAQISGGLVIRLASRGFVEIFRNIPTIVYLIFIYALFLTLPAPRAAFDLLGLGFFSNRGLYLPRIGETGLWPLFLALAAVTAALMAVPGGRKWLFRPDRAGLRRPALVLVPAVLASGLAALAAEGLPTISVPHLRGFNFQGGFVVPMEATAIVAALTIFGTAYIGEIVRGGLESVPRGLIEASEALGLSPVAIFIKVRMPMALRSIIPAIGNQYLYMMKGTTLGIVVGFPDLFAITTQSINYSGQTLEILAVMMAIFVVINFTLARMVAALNASLQPPGRN